MLHFNIQLTTIKNNKMKKTILTLTALIVIAGTLITSCKPSTKAEKESQEDVQEAKERVQDELGNLEVAKNTATAVEWQAFKKETDSAINKNETHIATLKLKVKKTEKSIDVKYKKSVDLLEQKNKNLKVKLNAYKNDANSDWKSFKKEFKHDMDEMGQSFKDLTVNNVK